MFGYKGVYCSYIFIWFEKVNCSQTFFEVIKIILYRFDKRNMILAALWFSADKPTMTTFMRPLIDLFNDLYQNGKRACFG